MIIFMMASFCMVASLSLTYHIKYL